MSGRNAMGQKKKKRTDWTPMPVTDPLGPVEIAGRSLFVSKEKSARITGKVNKRTYSYYKEYLFLPE